MDASNGNNNPVIIKKTNKNNGGHHGGAWKVAYADFVTAMMALFIVLWVLSQSDEIKSAVAGYFNNPLGVGIGKGKSIIEGQENNNSTPNDSAEILIREIEKERLTAMGSEILFKLEINPEFETIMDQIEMEIVDEGLRIEIMESNDDVFFDVNTARLNNGAESLLKIIGSQLSKLNNKIVIEGHTDALQYPTSQTGYSNYELSADRANAARRALIAGGVVQDQIDEIRGYAENRLRDKENPYSSVNRRISIIVKYSQNL